MAYTTRKSLLERARNGDAAAWDEFYRTYEKLICKVGRQCGMTHTEEGELVQMVMLEFVRKDILKKYRIDQVPENVAFECHPEYGRFRPFLRAVVRNQARKIYHKRPHHEPLEVIEKYLSDTAWDTVWLPKEKLHCLYIALKDLPDRMSAKNYAVFEMHVLHGRSAEKTAEFFDISISNLYTIKSRSIALLRKILADELELPGETAFDEDAFLDELRAGLELYEDGK